MKAIILAAGTGSRLRPLTDDRPKCLVALKGKPLLEYQLNTLRACGIEQIALVTGYQSFALEPYGLPCYRNPNFDSTNMVYSLFCAEAEFDDNDDLIICYGDIIFEERVLQALLSSDGEISVVVDRGWQTLWELRMEDLISDAESLKVDAGGYIKDIGKKVSSSAEIEGQYIGLIKISAPCLARVRAFYHALDRHARYDGKDFNNMFMTSFIQRLIDSGMPIKAAYIDHGWLEVDTLSDWQRYDAMDANNPLFEFTHLSSLL